MAHVRPIGHDLRVASDDSVILSAGFPKRSVGRDPLLLRRLLRAKDRMDGSPHEEWPIQRLAAVSCVSEAHFARSFRQAFGTPPHRYLLTRRIERAKELLRETGLGITAIALESGWDSLGTFSRTFRDVTGESPVTFRRHQKSPAEKPGVVPACYLSAARRPSLTIAVSEKRRQDRADTLSGTEVLRVP